MSLTVGSYEGLILFFRLLSRFFYLWFQHSCCWRVVLFASLLRENRNFRISRLIYFISFRKFCISSKAVLPNSFSSFSGNSNVRSFCVYHKSLSPLFCFLLSLCFLSFSWVFPIYLSSDKSNLLLYLSSEFLILHTMFPFNFVHIQYHNEKNLHFSPIFSIVSSIFLIY